MLYISDLSPATSPTSIAEILVNERKVCTCQGLTGLLVFDGTRLIHFLEGDHPELAATVSRIESDDQRLGSNRLHYRSIVKRQFLSLGIGYWYVEDDSHVVRLRTLAGGPAIDAFLALRSEFQIVIDPVAAATPSAPLPITAQL